MTTTTRGSDHDMTRNRRAIGQAVSRIDRVADSSVHRLVVSGAYAAVNGTLLLGAQDGGALKWLGFPGRITGLWLIHRANDTGGGTPTVQLVVDGVESLASAIEPTTSGVLIEDLSIDIASGAVIDLKSKGTSGGNADADDLVAIVRIEVT
ncbi:MAG: hypothetical protein AAGA55_09995 [Planctomycetota bacterium]